MGAGGSTPQSPCEAAGFKFCASVSHATGCENSGPDAFYCKCATGYRYEGRSEKSRCDDINECFTGEHDCATKMQNSMCENTPGSYQCVCGANRQLVDGKCEDKNECTAGNGGCGAFAKCVNNLDAAPTCICEPGYDGNNGQAGIDCKDIDECDTNPCPANSACINTPGSYKCECQKGFTMSPDNVCVSKNFCTEGANDCDPHLATCKQLVGTYSCSCKQNLAGTGKKGQCTPKEGFEQLPCELMGEACGAYRECKRDSEGNYSCVNKSVTSQISTMFKDGFSSDTPVWIWAVAGGGLIVAIVFLWLFLKKRKNKDRGGAGDYDVYGMGDAREGDAYSQTGYGTMDYYYG
ncbi:calcium binding egf domain-containing protein [Besnoitia besnoiti]|uniref:Calcium binding egf domain-containing protein n=1 Tax=Besnoitia besnoiti TaxID=94643 RepID=A0A2A9M6S4_BESBE|nr:calcium binding egf domain-containing protein [Besnoitia besnoiti]PFH33695.1 calcium binding egf domain-containing protein [Besnoitia besnoiti]